MNTDGAWQEIGLDNVYSQSIGSISANTDNPPLNIDTTFKPGYGPSRDDDKFVNVQSDGRIYIRSVSSEYDNNTINYAPIYRVNSDGTFDKTFDMSNSGVIDVPDRNTNEEDNYPYPMHYIVYEDKLIMSGYSSNLFYNVYPATPYYGLFKFNENGSIDGPFMRVMDAGFASPIYEFIAQPWSFVIHCASPNSFNGQPINSNLVRLFYDDETAYVDDLPSIKNYTKYRAVKYPVTNPKQYNYYEYFDRFTIKAANSNDMSNDYVYIWTPDDKYLTINNDEYYGIINSTPTTFGGQRTYGSIIRITPYALDNEFTSNATPISVSYGAEIKFKENGKILIKDDLTKINSTPSYQIIEINNDGSLSDSFIQNIHNIIPKSNSSDQISKFDTFNNKIIFSRLDANAAATPYLVRINNDGSSDQQFNSKDRSFSKNAMIHGLMFQPNGKILVLASGSYSYPLMFNENNLISNLFRINADNIRSQDININIDYNSNLYPFLFIGE